MNLDRFLSILFGKRTLLILCIVVLGMFCLSACTVEDAISCYVCGIPTCSKCGGVVRPDVVLYEEALNADNWDRATQLIREADLFIVGGTSLVVYPAAALVRAYHGKKMVLINMSSTPFDHYADLVIHKPIGATFSRIMEDLGYGC